MCSSDLDQASLIGEELRLLGRDQTFEMALKVAAKLIEPSGG